MDIAGVVELAKAWRAFHAAPSWLKVKWAILEYVAGDSPVVINMELVSHPVLQYNGPATGVLLSKVNITGSDRAIQVGRPTEAARRPAEAAISFE